MSKIIKFKNQKLVRDKVVDYIKNRGIKPTYRYLDNREFISCLKNKLIEEANEVSEEVKRHEIVKEICDVYEVLEHLTEAMEISQEEINKIRNKKKEKNGAFKNRIFLEYVEVDEEHEDIGYYLKKFR